MFLSVFDFYILILISIVNYEIVRYKIIKRINWKVFLVIFLFFGGIFPALSINFEIPKEASEGGMEDSFDFLSLCLKFPVWWVIGILEILFINFHINKSQATA